jgi:hypothetical protein
VEGELHAVGTAAEPVRLLAAPGSSFFPFVGTQASVIELDHVRAESPFRLLDATASSAVTIRNTQVVSAWGGNYGAVIALNSDVPATVEGLTISASGTAVQVGMAPATLTALRISDTGYGVVNHISGTVLSDSFFGPNVWRMVSTSVPMSAPRNWWGDPAGPPSGAIEGTVTESIPWCLDAACATLG